LLSALESNDDENFRSIIFGAIVEVFFATVFEKYKTLFTQLNITQKWIRCLCKITGQPQQAEVEAAH
jgi:isocitrate dehydrogenase